MSEFADANVFLRVLTGDDPTKAARSLALLERAEQGDEELVTSESVVAEVVFVLAPPATYRMARPGVANGLSAVIRNPGLRLDHKLSVHRAVDLWESSRLDFEDCLSVEHVRRLQLNGIYSYDRDFDRVPGISRLEP